MGASAGGHLASTLATHPEDISAMGDSLDQYPYHPDFQILVSPVITMGKDAHSGSVNNLLGENPPEQLIKEYSNELNVSASTSPCFIVHAANDRSVSPLNSIIYFEALLHHQVQASLHVFPEGGHSVGLTGNPGSTQLWTTLCKAWLKEMGFCRPTHTK